MSTSSRARARSISVDDKTSLGVMEIQPVGYDGPIKVMVYLGPRIPSDETSVRDGVGFITFGDFKEQTEYGKVGAEINNRVLAGLSSARQRISSSGRRSLSRAP